MGKHQVSAKEILKRIVNDDNVFIMMRNDSSYCLAMDDNNGYMPNLFIITELTEQEVFYIKTQLNKDIKLISI